ncbi:MAG: nitronate monooxygenase [Comamonadaceae bacterium]|nr:MAG: nitronate monooxygenase [Comamonadaceae bacterium]
MQVPIFGFSHCRDVVVAVSKAGGLGVYGAGLHDDETIATDIRWIEERLEGRPYGIDLMMPERYVGAETGGLSMQEAEARVTPAHDRFLADIMDRYGVPEFDGWDAPEPSEYAGGQRYSAHQAAGILDIAFASRCRLLVSALGTPPASVVQQAHAQGRLVAALAGKPRHALKHRAAGVDFVIAQSYEAGGHTGDIAGMVLVPQIVDAVAPLPVLAAGGIADGRQMAAALALGAVGVWCGSVWLTTAESECSPLVRAKLLRATSEDTVRTPAFTGKPARFLRSAWVNEWEREDAPPILPTPLHTIATRPYRRRIDRAAESGRYGPDEGAAALISKPVGQVVGMMNEDTSVRAVMTRMSEQCASVVAGLYDAFEE